MHLFVILENLLKTHKKMEEEIIETAETEAKKEKQRNQFLSLKVKIEILNKLKNGVKPISISNEYGIALSTISRLKKCKTSLQEAMNIYQNNSDRRSLRGTFHPKMETALHKWYLDQIKNETPVTGSVLRLKARELNKQIRENDLEFRASAGWMEKFKKRYGIRLKSCRGERHTTDNIAFEYDDKEDETTNANHSDVEVKSEEILYEPQFVTVNGMDDMDKEAKTRDFSKILQKVDEVTQWCNENKIEPLYLTMLKSLRERIRYQSMDFVQ